VSVFRLAGALLLLITSLHLQGCVTETAPKPRVTAGTPQGSTAPLRSPTAPASSGSSASNGKVATPAGENMTLLVRTGVVLLGAIPYDDLSLPLVSPDGRYLVSQTGIPPTWPTLRAEPSAEPPLETSLKVFLIDYSGDLHTGVVATVEEGVLLGRTSAPEGFLVESPRSDGSRWIGVCSWATGAITWLVQGGDVNAFASMNAQGDLAWSRRTAGSEHFQLVVKRADGVTMVLGETGEDWVMPQWGNQRDRIFAMRVRGGTLTATYISTASESAMSRPLHELELAIDASVDTAYQCMAPHPTTLGVRGPALDTLLLFHPVQQTTMIWAPMAGVDRRVTLIPGGSIAACMDDSPFAMVTTRSGLIRQNLLVPQQRKELLAGLLVPRATTSVEWPFVLLAPARPGQIGLTALRLLPPGEAIE